MKMERFVKYALLVLLGLLILIGLATIFTQASNYGITWDEPIQDHYGQDVLKRYESLGHDTRFLTSSPPDTYMPEHGGFFDAMIAAVQQQFPASAHWQVRRIFTALTGLLGIVAIALCGYELGGYWVAFLAALALWLYPRYYGAIYNNPKDIPAAVAMTFVLWAALLLIRQWGRGKYYIRNSILLGFFIGLAASIRVNSVIWYPLLALILVAWWLFQGRRVWQEQRVYLELVKQVIAVGTIGVTSLVTMMVFWPYIALNPFVNLFHSIDIMSHYPWNGVVLYDGKDIPATQLPLTYAPKWLVIGSPPVLVIFTLVGLVIASVLSFKKRLIDPRIAIIFLSFIVPLGAIILLHSVLYDGLRQFLFLVPAMILIAVYGFVQAVTYLAHKKQKTLRLLAAGLVLVTLASYVLVVQEMVTLSPFEATYFSPIVGGLHGANGVYETDYWATCNEQAAQWLGQNYRRYTAVPNPIVEGFPQKAQIAPYLPPAFQPETYQDGNKSPDFYISSTRENKDQRFPSYTVIHVIAREGTPFCVIKAKPATAHS